MQIMSSPVVPQRLSHVANEFGSLDESITMLLNVISDLEQRLCPVIRACPPEVAGRDAPKPISEVLVPLAEIVRNMRAKVDTARVQLTSMMDRLEL